jgi:hypothetical protein
MIKDRWTTDDISRLKRLYPNQTQRVILDAFKGRSWNAIQKAASRLGIKRILVETGIIYQNKDQLSASIKTNHSLKLVIKKKTLQRLFIQQELTVDEIAFKLKVHSDVVRRCIFRYGL